jgi:outer membrane protein assembly factor BamD (BamD/ComL family)
MTTKKMTKHQMKEDRLVTSMFKGWEWVQFHTKTLAIGIGSAILLVLVIVLYTAGRGSNSRKAAELFGVAIIQMESPIAGEVQSAVSNFQVLLNEYSGSKWSPYACFYLGNLLYRDKQYPQAREYFQRYVRDYGDDSLMTASAYAGIGDCYFQEKDLLSAAEYYLKGAEASPNSILAPGYLLQAARVYLKADQRPKAVEIYQRLASGYPQTLEGNRAKSDLAELVTSS